MSKKIKECPNCKCKKPKIIYTNHGNFCTECIVTGFTNLVDKLIDKKG